MLIEVADSTLAGDRFDKSRIYARAGVACYWIVNLVDRQVEVYEQPSGSTPTPAYGRQVIHGIGDQVALVLDGVTAATIAVQDMLP